MNYMIFIVTDVESEALRDVILHMVVFIYWLQFIGYLVPDTVLNTLLASFCVILETTL